MTAMVKDHQAQISNSANAQPWNAESLREEAARVLQHSLFSNSERSSKLLRYLVAISLRNPSTPVKERTIGHDVFGREAAYDTYADPIVRNAASEVRRRLKRYYEAAPKDEPRIQLPAGQYMVILQLPNQRDAHENVDLHQDVEEPTPDPAEEYQPLQSSLELAPERVSRDRRVFLQGLAATLALPTLLFGGFELGRRHPVISPDNFWASILQASNSILLCIESRFALDSEKELNSNSISFPAADGVALSRVAERLAQYGARSTVVPDVKTTMSDMRDSTPVLIGQATHLWIQRILPELRFQYGKDESAGTAWIEDRKEPTRRWSIKTAQQGVSNFTDYAIAARLKSELTGGIVVVLSGLGSAETCACAAAAEYVTTDRYLSSLARGVADPDKNVQFVLKTTIVDGVSGAPEVVAQAMW